MRDALADAALWFVIVASALLAGAYVGNTILYLMPPNPLKAIVLPVIERIEHPLFAQNWHLFAPVPVSTNYVIEVRCRSAGQREHGARRVTTWQDITTPLLRRFHQNRFAPYGHLLRVQQSALLHTLGWRPDEWTILYCRKRPALDASCLRTQWTATQRALGLMILDRIASRTCDAVLGDGRAGAVQIRVLSVRPAESESDLL